MNMLHSLVRTKVEEVATDNFMQYDDVFGVHLNSSSRRVLIKGLVNKLDTDITLLVPDNYIENTKKYFKKLTKNLLPDNITCIIAGGSVSTFLLYQNEAFINDIDIFPSSLEDLTTLVYFFKFNKNFNCVETNNAWNFDSINLKVDIIKTIYPTSIELFDHFDFNVCKFGFEVKENEFTFIESCPFDQLFELSLKITNIKRYDTDLKKVKLMQRVVKYMEKGFTLDHYQITNLATSMLTKTSSDYYSLLEAVKKMERDDYLPFENKIETTTL